MKRRPLALCLAVLLGATALPPSVLAAGRQDAGKDLADQAAALFKDAKFLQAAELFERAYALSPDKLVRLRNAGRAYEEAGRLEYARLVFQRYVELAPEGPDKAEVRERVARLDHKLKPPPPNALPAAPPGPPAVARTAQRDVALRKVEPPSHTLGWTLTGTGGAVMAGGLVWLLAVNRAQTRRDDDATLHHYDYPGGAEKLADDESTLSTQRGLAFATLGIGAAALGYGLYDLLKAPPRDATRPPVALAPWFAPQQAGFLATARF